ncbi:helix-turn-helix domain-containing protein [uncultured Bilophila sp.]|uniref:helix-turn-helix domain-containing protein n=1 Tax=uncultured Bilophila sp. TaxID=529385 RepID=UPI00280B7FEE|nr:helix-turn-helix domain-containing protein [uncultured Bilophila sp.]
MKKDVSYPDVIKRIQAATHTRSQTELASLLEISQSSVAEAKRRQSIPADWYLKLFEKLGVNPDWLKSAAARYTCAQRPGTSPATGRGRP